MGSRQAVLGRGSDPRRPAQPRAALVLDGRGRVDGAICVDGAITRWRIGAQARCHASEEQRCRGKRGGAVRGRD
jgi:hypothetical protein